jgi:hypothetical protein
VAVVLGTIEQTLLVRMRSEYREMPGLRLTAHQAYRLWNLDAPLCDALLDELVHSGFLRRSADGCFVRADARP